MLQTPPVGRAVRHCIALLHRKQSVVCRLLFSRAGRPDQSPGGYFLDELRSWSKSGNQEPVVLPWCKFCGGDWETDVRTAAGRWASPVPLARPICDQIFFGQRRRARQSWWFSGDAACFVWPVSEHCKAISDVREDQGVDYDGEKRRGDLMTHVVQSDENTTAFFDEGRYVRVPREVPVE